MNNTRNQAEAFGRMHGDPQELIPEYGAEFREIINDIERTEHRSATADDLLWIASEHAGKDLTK